MSEILDLPPVTTRPPQEQEERKAHIPMRYQIEAWTAGVFCSGKFITFTTDEFGIPYSVAARLSSIMKTTFKVPVMLDLSKEIAESKADQATQRMIDLVADCPCGSKIKFIAVPQP